MRPAANPPYESCFPTQAMRIDIDKLTEAELIDLNHRIVARLKVIAELLP